MNAKNGKIGLVLVTLTPWNSFTPNEHYKRVTTTGEIFSLKFTKYRSAAGLRPDPLGELKRSHRPPSHNKGAYF